MHMNLLSSASPLLVKAATVCSVPQELVRAKSTPKFKTHTVSIESWTQVADGNDISSLPRPKKDDTSGHIGNVRKHRNSLKKIPVTLDLYCASYSALHLPLSLIQYSLY